MVFLIFKLKKPTRRFKIFIIIIIITFIKITTMWLENTMIIKIAKEDSTVSLKFNYFRKLKR